MSESQQGSYSNSGSMKKALPVSSKWPIAMFGIGALVLIGYMTWKSFDTLDRGVDFAGNIPGWLSKVVPASKTSVIWQSTIGKINSEPKLVVLTTTLNVEVEWKDEWLLGTKIVRVNVPGNKVQYFIPISRMTADSFRFDKKQRQLRVMIPAPQIDQQMVDIQSDPTKWRPVVLKGDWNPFAPATERAVEKAKRQVRITVLREAKNELLMDKARLNAKVSVELLLDDLIGSLRDDIQLEVQFVEITSNQAQGG